MIHKQVPTPRVSGRFHSYQMSWEMYRALQGKPYSGFDRMMDEQILASEGEQVLMFDHDGNVSIRMLSQGFAARFRKSQADQQKKSWLDQHWSLLNELSEKYQYTRSISDSLLTYRKNLESLDA